jgi:hypothetical protein
MRRQRARGGLGWDTRPVRSPLRRRRAARAPARPCRPDPAPARCPRCGSPLKLGPFGQDRLIGACPGRRCGMVVILHTMEGRLVAVGRRRR